MFKLVIIRRFIVFLWFALWLFSVIFRVYCADHTYCTLRFPINTTAEMIKASAADKLQINRQIDDLVLVEVKSNGERTIYKDHDVSIPTALYLNARIFVSSKDHIDALVRNNCLASCFPSLLRICWISNAIQQQKFRFFAQTPLPEQEGMTDGIELDLEASGTKELAFHITLFDWDLFWSIHEYELLYHTFGRHHFGKVNMKLHQLSMYEHFCTGSLTTFLALD